MASARFHEFCNRYSRLAYHYGKASAHATAVAYLDKAAHIAEINNANEVRLASSLITFNCFMLPNSELRSVLLV